MIYPLILTPPCMDYLWGGEKLKKEYNIKTDKKPCAEAWMLADRNDYSCTVQNGEYAGRTLKEVLDIWSDEVIGENAAKFPYFPLLIKLIDAKSQLSVQVHPNDEYAMKVEGEFGKTEMWYVVDCEPGAYLYYGFKNDLTKDEFKSYIEQNRLDEVCNKVAVHKGDCFFIPSGMLHSIGAGILVAEVQQNSNTTYRVYDFGRVGADGKPRALHIDKALDVTSLKATDSTIENSEYEKVPGGKIRPLVKCDYFTSSIVDLDTKMNFRNDNSFISLVCLDGVCDATYKGGSFRMVKGMSVFVPAKTDLTIYGMAKLLKSEI